jgi:hypothetical protein
MNGLPEWMRPRAGYRCREVFEYEHEGEAYFRACGRCRDCIAIKKRDVAGRAGAEALTAAQVVVWTLTYRNGEPGAVDFETPDRQKFLKRLRDYLLREARRAVGAPKRRPKGAADHVAAYWKHRVSEVLPRVRFLGCGERGSRNTKRCHWHIVLFLSKRSPFVSTPRGPDGKPGHEDHALWPHGFVNVHVLESDMEAKMRAARYAIKYLDKSRAPSKFQKARGVKAEARFFRSLASPLGFEFLTEWAREHARKGVPLHEKYKVPGVYFSHAKVQARGFEKPRLMEHVITGRMRDHYIAAYRDEWALRRAHVDVPMTEFMMRHDPDAVFRSSPWARLNPVKWRPRKPQRAPEPERPKRDLAGFLMVNVIGRGCVGTVQMLRSGFCQFVDAEGVLHPVPHGNIRDVADLDHDGHVAVENWISDRRGPGWLSGRERRLKAYERQLAQRDAILKFALRGPKRTPAHVAGLEPMTALARKLAMNGLGHVPGVVVRDPTGHNPPYVRPVTGLLRPISKRPA